ncbi:MAG: DUF4347 domain-containing protein, partial [Actinomycetia bacterium]|nr:DUF4347 domain-containing protein [Actinomycetes bacterium]
PRLLLSAAPFAPLDAPPPDAYNPYEVVCEVGLLDHINDSHGHVLASERSDSPQVTDDDAHGDKDAASTCDSSDTLADRHVSTPDHRASQNGASDRPDPGVANPVAHTPDIVFLDTAVDDHETLMAGIDPATEIVLLDPARDGVEQIAEALEGLSGIDAIHLITEGDSAQLRLG